MSAGSRSGVNWMRWNLARSAVGDRLDRQRLGEAGHAFEQHVAAGEQADEDALDHVALADDDLADLAEQLLGEGRLLLHQLVDDFDVVGHLRLWIDSTAREASHEASVHPAHDEQASRVRLCRARRGLAANSDGSNMGGNGSGDDMAPAGGTRGADSGLHDAGRLPVVGQVGCSRADLHGPGVGAAARASRALHGGYTCDAGGVCVGGNAGNIAHRRQDRQRLRHRDAQRRRADDAAVVQPVAVDVEGDACASSTPRAATRSICRCRARRRRSRGRAWSSPAPTRSSSAATATTRACRRRRFVANAALDVSADAPNVALDVKTASVGGTVTLNGAAPTTTAAVQRQRQRRQGDRAPRRRHRRLPLRSRRALLVDDVPVGRRRLPRHLRGQPSTATPATATCREPAFVANPALAVSGTVANQALDIKTVQRRRARSRSTASRRPRPARRGRPTPRPRSTSPTPSRATASTFPIPCAPADYAWSGAVYPGTYVVTVDGGDGYSNLPTPPSSPTARSPSPATSPARRSTC